MNDPDDPQPSVPGGRSRASRALEHQITAIYGELRRLAASSRAREPVPRAWQTSDLAHEAYIRLCDQRDLAQRNPEELWTAAAHAVRRVLVDHARRRRAQKRGGAWGRVALDRVDAGEEHDQLDILSLEEALVRLAALDARQARVVEMRFFAGLSVEEVAGILSVSTGTVKSDWFAARAFLRRELTRE